MFGSSAITGYYRQLRDLEDRCNARAYSLEYKALMGSGDVYRVFTWTNLLKHLTLATTPDVVAIWAIATTQAHLLNKFVQRTEGSQHMWKHYDYIRPNSWGDPVCECEEGCFGDVNGKVIFPKEMYQMAHRYLKYRLTLFIRAINETVTEQTYNIERGMATNPNVFRAVLSYPSSTEIGTVISNLKALNATITADAVMDGWDRDWNKYPTTMYDPSKYNKSDARVSLEVVDGRFMSHIRKIRSDTQWIYRLLVDTIPANDIGGFNMYKEVFCLAADTLLTIIDSFGGRCYSSDSHKPDISNLYQYIFEENAESSGKDAGSSNDRQSDIVFRRARQLKRLTPAAALCLNDSFISGFRDGWGPEWALAAIDQLCPKHANCDVLGFIWGEYQWSLWAEKQLKRIIDIQKSDNKGGPDHE